MAIGYYMDHMDIVKCAVNIVQSCIKQISVGLLWTLVLILMAWMDNYCFFSALH